MAFNYPDFETKLKTAVVDFDKSNAEKLVNEFIGAAVSEPEMVSEKNAEDVLQLLRQKRFFDLMEKTGSMFYRNEKLTPKGRRLYGQGLIEKGMFDDAIKVLEEIPKIENVSKGEYREAFGLLGRVYKQLYVNDPAAENNKEYLDRSLACYYNIYKEDPEKNFYQGINAAAMQNRAKRDGIELKDYPSADKIAGDLLNAIGQMDEASLTTWDFGTAMEANLALGNDSQALVWLNKYISSKNADAFELGSTLRQMKEVWNLNLDSGMGKHILPVLQAELLSKENGRLTINPSDIGKQTQASADDLKNYEKVFGADRFKTYKWYLKGLNCCSAVARIGRDSTKGFGTGFLMQGKEIHPGLDNEIVLLTNAHVVSDEPLKNNNSLLPEEAVVILETIDRDLELQLKAVFRSSGIDELDVSVLQFDEASLQKLEDIKDKISFYKVSKLLPATDGKNRVYIIGHPAGGTLQLSLQDNVFLAQKDPFLHYRTPTEGGSSGSPVFNENWELIGIHHAGDEQMQHLGEPGKTYEANEGIWIQSILKKINS